MAIDHEVKPGDCISSIAFEHGFFPGTIWDHPANAALKQRRVDMNVLLPGDHVIVPDRREKELTGETGKRHTFRRRGVPQLLRVQLKRLDKPFANRAYTMDVDGHPYRGATDGEGWLVQYIQPNAMKATVKLDRGPVYHLNLGKLAPIDEIAGIKSRLANVGMYRGPIDDQLDAKTREAIRAYQTTKGLEPTGEIDDRLKDSLKEAVGS